MVPFKVVLAVRETQYMEPLLHFVNSSEFGDKMRMVAFTRVDTFTQYMNGEDQPDVVVGEAVFLENWLREEALDSKCPWILLTSGEGTHLHGPTLAKYQPLPDLLTSILNHCQRTGNRITVGSTNNSEDTAIIGVVSTVGGSGKTTTAVNMAKQLGANGMSVFYLNLETVNSSAVFPRLAGHREQTSGLPGLLYEMKAAQDEKDSAPILLDPFVVHHPGLKSDWFEPVFNMKELIQLGKNDAARLLEIIAGSGRYDALIVDTDTGINERTEAVLERSHHLVWMLLDDLISMHKCGQWLSFVERHQPVVYTEMAGKSRFVVNRYVGDLTNALPKSIRGIDGFLPYIPSWKQNANEELLLSSPIFQRDILKLCRELLGEQLGAASGARAYG